MGDWGWRRIDAEAAWHILIPACSKSAKGAIQMDHPSPHTRSSSPHPVTLVLGTPRKGAVHAKPRPFVSASLEPQTGQHGQKPFGVAKNSKTETFRRCRI
jgi:hypothetical protein